MLLFEVEEVRGKSRVVVECLQSSENEKSDRVLSGVTSSTEMKIQLAELKHLEHFYFFADSASSK